MRILFVTPFYYPELRFGGPPQKIHAVACGLRKRGHSVRVVTFDHAARQFAGEKQVDDVPVQYLPWAGFGLRQMPLERGKLRCELEAAEVVHCYGIYTLLTPVAAWLARRANIPTVQEPLGMYPPRARNQIAKQLYNALITRKVLRNAAAVIAASENEAAALRNFAPKANVLVRRNGIDVDAFANLPSGDELRRRWQIGMDEKAVLFVGRLSPIKNLEQLIVAFARAQISQTRLILVGPAEAHYERRLRDVVAREQLGSRVVIAAALYGDEQKAALAAADLFVLPSLSESFGNAAAEAVAAGVPVLLSDTCGIAPIIHQRAGLAVPPGVDSLTAGLKTMLDPQERGQFTAKIGEVTRELSWDEPIAQTEQLYERIIATNKKS